MKRSRKEKLKALKKESELALEEMVKRRLALPISKRMNFLRKRLPGGGSGL
jgi:hypothetical protein